MPDLFVSARPHERVRIKLAPYSVTPDNPAPIDGGPVVTVLSGDGSFAPDPDNPMNVFVIPPPVWTGATIEYEVKGDRDMSSGEDFLVNKVTLTALPPQATDLGLSDDPAEPQ